MKAQMSLEMIIGLLILLVVAAVIISLFMSKIKEFTSMSNWQEDLDFRKFKSDCESLCKEGSEGQILQYCSGKLNKKDLNGNHRIEALPSDTSALPMCEDAIYCFHVAKCQSQDGETIDAKACKEILCRAWVDAYNGDLSKASTKVMTELVPGYGTCTIKDDENWWRVAKFGPEPPCGGTVQQSVSLSCAKDSGNPTTIVCIWICPASIYSSSSGLLQVANTERSYIVTNATGSTSFPGLNAGTSYTVNLVCDRTNPAISTSQQVQL
jgi:hypothetical protein